MVTAEVRGGAEQLGMALGSLMRFKVCGGAWWLDLLFLSPKGPSSSLALSHIRAAMGGTLPYSLQTWLLTLQYVVHVIRV